MPFTDDEILERLKNYLSIEGDWSLQDNKFKSPVFNTANDAQQAADRMDAPFLWGYRPPLIEQNADEPGFRIVLPGDLARNFLIRATKIEG